MSRRPMPGAVHGVTTHLRLHWVRLVRGRKLRLGLVAVGLVMAVTWAAAHLAEDADPALVMRGVIEWGFFTLLVFLIPFLMQSGAIAEEVEGRTFGYLAARPSGRLAITLGKYLAGLGMTLALLLGGLLLTHVGVYLVEPDRLLDGAEPTLQAAGALVLLAAYYGGVCLFWGSVAPETAGILATLHLAAIEFLFTWAPGLVRLVSMNHMARALAGLPFGGFMAAQVPRLETPVRVVVLAMMTLGALAVSAAVVQMREYRHGSA